MEDFEIRGPPEIIAAFREARRSGSWIEAVCPFCGKGPKDRKLRAGLFRGRPWWGCMRCHCEKDLAAAERTARMRTRVRQSDELETRKYALGLIDNSWPIRRGDCVDLYLRGRGLEPKQSSWPAQLARARLKHPETKQFYDAMLATVQSASGERVACHRTFLFCVEGCVVKASDPRVPAKLRVETAKMSLASIAGAAIHLGPDCDEIGVCEGIESALGFAMHTGLTVWAAISCAGMQELVLPSHIRRIVIGPDVGDKGGPRGHGKHAGMKAALALKNRLHSERRIRVDILPPPFKSKDWAQVYEQTG